MTRQEFAEFLSRDILILDGATGSNLQKAGMPTGVCPEQWILENKEVLIQLQEEYIKAGSNVIYAPTFGCNRIKLEEYGLEEQIEDMHEALIQLSKEAIKRANVGHKVYVAGDLTMTGRQLVPVGNMEFEELVDIYKEQVMYMLSEGVDLFVVETMMSLNECRAAVLAVKEISDLPVMVTLTFQENHRTFYGTNPKSAVLVLQSMGVDAIGVNCSTGPEHMITVLEEMKSYATVPLIAKPNAGLPMLVDGETVFSMGSIEFAEDMLKLIKLGVRIVGGCCGTTPEHIKELSNRIQEYRKEYPTLYTPITHGIRALATETTVLEIPLEGEFLVIGERINPTGKKLLQSQLKEGNLDLVVDMAMEQVDQGAKILDINMGMNGIDEQELMLKSVLEISKAVDVPLAIDSSHISVIEAALRSYPGRALINSISLEKEKMDVLLPIAKKYGAMFILLPLSEKGLPKDNVEKNNIIDTIIKEALSIGLTKEDIIVDGLVNTIGANTRAAYETLETIKYCKESLGVATVMGLSNISFGLPERQYVNSTFLSLSIFQGLTMAIANPAQELLMNSAYATNLLQGTEDSDVRYIERVTTRRVQDTKKNHSIMNRTTDEVCTISGNEKSNQGNQIDSLENQKKDKTLIEEDCSDQYKSHPIFLAVIKGNKRKILELVDYELNNQVEPSILLHKILIPAINQVGELFDKQIYFLPQLISSAETMKIAIERIEPLLQVDNAEKKGKVVIATVAGDVHDIGKNLVALMLKNYGYEVIDLGKDVPSQKIIEVAIEEKADVIGLSALMTTTMLEMKEVIRLKNEANLDIKIVIGGAVITESYALEIGADGYGKDAGETVHLVDRLLKL